jgi:hypothetical protein
VAAAVLSQPPQHAQQQQREQALALKERAAQFERARISLRVRRRRGY